MTTSCMGMPPSAFLQFVKNDITKEKNNYAAVSIKTLIESGLNDEMKEGKSELAMAKPPICTGEEIYEKLIQSNSTKPNFDAKGALESVRSLLSPFAGVGHGSCSLTLEFNAKEIREILKICEQEISLK